MRAVLQVFENYQKARVNFVQTVAEQGAHTVHVSMEKYFKNENRKARVPLFPRHAFPRVRAWPCAVGPVGGVAGVEPEPPAPA